MQFVLDCSVAIAWCLVDENDAYANAILVRHRGRKATCILHNTTMPPPSVKRAIGGSPAAPVVEMELANLESRIEFFSTD